MEVVENIIRTYTFTQAEIQKKLGVKGSVKSVDAVREKDEIKEAPEKFVVRTFEGSSE